MSDISRDAAKYGVVNQSVAYPYVKTESTPGARSPIRPRNTSSCEMGYARKPHTPIPPDIVRATRARASTILRSMEDPVRLPLADGRRFSGGSRAGMGPSKCGAFLAVPVVRAWHERALMRLAPLHELLVASEHGVDHLIQDVLGRFAQELRVRIERLVVLAIESRAVLHELFAARSRLDQWHDVLRSGRSCDVGHISRRCARRAGIPLRDQALCRVDDECAVTFVRTNETRSRGVSDPVRAGLRAKSGAAETGSLTPRLLRAPCLPAVPGSLRGKRRRAVCLQQPPYCQRHAILTARDAPELELARCASTTVNAGERCSRVSVPPPVRLSMALMPSPLGRRDGDSRGPT